MSQYSRIKKAFYATYSKPIPIWRLLFCTVESNDLWYLKKLKREMSKEEK